MERMLKVLVIGSSSGVGLQVTKKLLNFPGRFEVFCLVRNQEGAKNAIGKSFPSNCGYAETSEEASKVNFIHGDITKKETLEPACHGMDAVVCTVGARAGWRLPGFDQDTPKNIDYLGVKNLSDVAATEKVPKFVLVSSMFVTRPFAPVAMILNTSFGKVLSWKNKGEESLREAYRKDANLSYYIVRPGGLTNKAGGKKGIFIEQGDKGNGMIAREDVASVVIACVEGKCVPNSTFEIENSAEDETPDLSGLLQLVPDHLER